MDENAAGSSRVVVGYVGGTGRSGSTLLCRALARIPGVVNVGELVYLWNQSVRKNHPCSCGHPFLSCPFWTQVGLRAFGGWDRSPVERADALRRQVERTRHVLALGGLATRQFRSAADEYAEIMDRVFVAIRDEAGAQVVVDNSKYPSSALLRSRQRAVDLRLIHLVRDSHGVAYSWSKQIDREDFGGRRMRSFSPTRAAFDWTFYNWAFEMMGHRGMDYIRVRYEDFVARPTAELVRISSHLGLQVSPDQLDFVGDGTIDLLGDHSVWGNPMRVRTGPQQLRPDDAWRSALPSRHRRTVTALSWPGLHRYGYTSDPR